jgi:hypothetical protein
LPRPAEGYLILTDRWLAVRRLREGSPIMRSACPTRCPEEELQELRYAAIDIPRHFCRVEGSGLRVEGRGQRTFETYS